MPIVRALAGLLIGCLMGVATAYVQHYWRLARWHRHEPPGFLIGWLRADGFFILHLGPGYLEWGSLAHSIRKPEPKQEQLTYLRPRWMR